VFAGKINKSFIFQKRQNRFPGLYRCSVFSIKTGLLSEMFGTVDKEHGVDGQIEQINDINKLIARARELNAPVVVAGISLASETGIVVRTEEGLLFVSAQNETRVLRNDELPLMVREALEKKLPVSTEPRVMFMVINQGATW